MNKEAIDTNELVLLTKIDEGGQGEVYDGLYKGNEIVVKIYKKFYPKDVKEVEVYKLLDHEIMVKFYGCYLDNDKKLNIILEKAKGLPMDNYVLYELDSKLDEKNDKGGVKNNINTLTFKEKLYIILKLCDFLIYLKANNVIHRDLKPSNLMIVKTKKEETLNNSEKKAIIKVVEKDSDNQNNKNKSSLLENIIIIKDIEDVDVENKNIEKINSNNTNNANIVIDDNKILENEGLNQGINDKHQNQADISNKNLTSEEESYNLTIKVIDFGISKISEKTFTYSTNYDSLSLHYSAPEMYSKTDDMPRINNKIDIWALGCIISYIFSGVIPWTNKNKNLIRISGFLANKSRFPIPEKWFFIPEKDKLALEKILAFCFEIDPNNRINAHGLYKLINTIYLDKDFNECVNSLKQNSFT
jgi:serine/threonine protein kinase